MKKIVGFEKFHSKKGTLCCAVSVEEEIKERTGVQSAGVKAYSIMIFGDDTDVITEKSVGHELVGYFGYSNGSCFVQSPEVR